MALPDAASVVFACSGQNSTVTDPWRGALSQFLPPFLEAVRPILEPFKHIHQPVQHDDGATPESRASNRTTRPRL